MGTGYHFIGKVSALTRPHDVHDVANPSDRSTEPQAPLATAPPSSFLVPSPMPSLPPSEHVAPSTPERRHVSVLSCTLLESHGAPPSYDPEAVYDRTMAIQRVCADVMSSFEGVVTQQQDDALVAYFGYPQAHEDDAHRAIRSGLELVARLRRAVEAETARPEPTVKVRVGIHTGVVIVEPGVAASSAALPLAVGSVPKQAEWVRQMAGADAVIISEATAQLVEGYFELKPLASTPSTHRPHPGSIVAYEVRGVSALKTRLEVGAARGLTPFVGRGAELELLKERWALAREGLGQVVWLQGEAGIGKSRLVQAWQEQQAEIPSTLACHCSPYHQHTLLYPVVRMLHQGIEGSVQTAAADQLELLLRPCPISLDEAVPLLAGLLSLTLPEGRYPPLTLSPDRQRALTLETLVSVVLAQAAASPLLLVVEDVHWADPSTLEFLGMLFEQVSLAPLLVVVSSRPEFELPWPQQLPMTLAMLHRLTRSQTEVLIAQVAAGQRLPKAVVEQVIDKTDGVPLYVEELVRMVMEWGEDRDDLGPDKRHGEGLQLTIPATLRDALMARLDRLGAAKELAQWGSVIGREFGYEVLTKVTSYDAPTTQALLKALVTSGLVLQQGLVPWARYRFKHALIQDAAYDSLLRRHRQAMHERIAEVLEAHFADTVEAHPELVAHHYAAGVHAERALPFWQRAGQQAIARSAHHEATHYLQEALELARRLPDSDARRLRELEVLMLLGPLAMALKGHAVPEVQHVYERARHLCEQLGDIPQLFTVLWGLWRFYLNRPALTHARTLSERLCRLAEQSQDTGLRLQAHTALGATLNYLGEFASASTHSEIALSLYDASRHRTMSQQHAGYDLAVHGLVSLATVLWFLGFPDQALVKTREALSLSRQLAHPYTLASALNFAAVHHVRYRMIVQTQDLAEELIAIATEHGFTQWLVNGKMLRGWALSERGNIDAGLEQLQEGLAANVATGAKLALPSWYLLLAVARRNRGDVTGALDILDDAVILINRTEERRLEAETYRLKGECVLLQAASHDARTRAEACFQQSLDLARQQQARSLELRTATSLARLWQSQGKGQEAYDLLAPVYGWFTEGFDTADLKDASALLHELAAGSASSCPVRRPS